MPNGLGVAAIIPSATAAAVVPCEGAVAGANILQVLNLVTGANVTTSFDPYIPATDVIVQLNTTPSPANVHLVSFHIPGGDAITTKFAVVNSLSDDPGTQGAVSAPSVQVGDIIIRAFSPVTNFNYGAPVDLTALFAPTVILVDNVTQIEPISTVDATLLLLRNAAAVVPIVDFVVHSGVAPDIWAVPTAQHGQQVVAALDLTIGGALTSYFAPLVPTDGVIYQASGPTRDSVALVLLRTSPVGA